MKSTDAVNHDGGIAGRWDKVVRLSRIELIAAMSSTAIISNYQHAEDSHIHATLIRADSTRRIQQYCGTTFVTGEPGVIFACMIYLHTFSHIPAPIRGQDSVAGEVSIDPSAGMLKFGSLKLYAFPLSCW